MKKHFERLKNAMEFEQVFKKGSIIISEDKKLKATYVFMPCENNSKIRYGISVFSKKGNSVWRNRLKRIIREIIRVETRLLLDTISSNKTSLSIIFSPCFINQKNSEKIYFKEITISFKDIINRMIKTPIHTESLT